MLSQEYVKVRLPRGFWQMVWISGRSLVPGVRGPARRRVRPIQQFSPDCGGSDVWWAHGLHPRLEAGDGKSGRVVDSGGWCGWVGGWHRQWPGVRGVVVVSDPCIDVTGLCPPGSQRGSTKGAFADISRVWIRLGRSPVEAMARKCRRPPGSWNVYTRAEKPRQKS